ncbi:MaoC family dehydratase [Streptomyces sp. NBC_01465]|uniref:MaoC family dehydratase n=1 Tax=Streptomyces sp. NBC_01465 TaxID=2903878 RepID=UPI002E3006A6|nr:MaoC/PaaZ C-terminal domain-containing protein [Streptomyces sp. NBC_01465]
MPNPHPLPATLIRAALVSPLRRRRPFGPDSQLPDTRLTFTTTPHPGRLAAYARLCGHTRTDPLPLPYPHVLAFPLAMQLMASPGFPLPLLGLVHTRIEITAHQPLHPTHELELTVYASELTPHHRGTEVTMVTEARLAGDLVWESRSGYLARHRTTATTTQTAPTDPPKPLPATTTWELPADLGRRYASASGDRNPIHLHPLTARLFGFPRAIAHGMWTFARCLAESEEDPQPTHVRADFRSPVLLPSTITYAAKGPHFQLQSTSGTTTRIHLTGETAPTAPPA